MSEAIYTKHGIRKDTAPCFLPDARGLLIVTEHKRKLSEKLGTLINLNAQQELKALSGDFAAAQDWWAKLPQTPARHLFNAEESVSDILLAGGIAQRWAAQFDELDGLAYIFDVARTVNRKNGATQTEASIFTFSRGRFEELTFGRKRDCLRYHLYFAYYEKPETLKQRLSIQTDSLSAKREITPG